MAVVQEPRNDIFYDWDQGDNNWATGMNTNLEKLGSLLNVSALDIVNADPVGPANGDTYIVGVAGTGAFSGQDNNIAIYFDNVNETLWKFFTPINGLTAFIQTGTFANQLIAFNGTSWSTNGFQFTFT